MSYYFGSVVVKATDFEVKLSSLESKCYLLAVWLWLKHLSSLWFCFLATKIRWITTLFYKVVVRIKPVWIYHILGIAQLLASFLFTVISPDLLFTMKSRADKAQSVFSCQKSPLKCFQGLNCKPKVYYINWGDQNKNK